MKKKNVDFDELSDYCTPEASPGYLLWCVSTLWRRAIAEALKPLKLTHPQFVVLATVGWLTRDGAKPSQADVGRHSGLDPNTTSQILRGLQAKKFIQRSHSLDERTKSPSLTDAGAELLKNALPAVEQADALFFKGLDLKKSGLVKALQNLLVFHQ